MKMSILILLFECLQNKGTLIGQTKCSNVYDTRVAIVIRYSITIVTHKSKIRPGVMIWLHVLSSGLGILYFDRKKKIRIC